MFRAEYYLNKLTSHPKSLYLHRNHSLRLPELHFPSSLHTSQVEHQAGAYLNWSSKESKHGTLCSLQRLPLPRAKTLSLLAVLPTIKFLVYSQRSHCCDRQVSKMRAVLYFLSLAVLFCRQQVTK